MVSPKLASALKKAKSLGRGGDTMLAHINPTEAQILKRLGGSGTINPHTKLPEFDNPSMGSYDGAGDISGNADTTGWGGEGASYGSWSGGGGGGGGYMSAGAIDASQGTYGDAWGGSSYSGGGGGYSTAGATDAAQGTYGDSWSGGNFGFGGGGGSSISSAADSFGSALSAGAGIAQDAAASLGSGFASLGDTLNGWIGDAQPSVNSFGNQLADRLGTMSDSLNAGLANGYGYARDYISEALNPQAPVNDMSYTQTAAAMGNPGFRSEAAMGNYDFTPDVPQAAPAAPATNERLDRAMQFGDLFGGIEIASPFVGTPMGIQPSSQQQFLDQLGIQGSSQKQAELSVGPGGRISDAVASARAASAATGLPESLFMSSLTLNPAWSGTPTKENIEAQRNAGYSMLGSKGAGLRPEYVGPLADAVALMGNRTGVAMNPVSAFRSPEIQASLYAQGRTAPGSIVTNAPPGSSFHNWGLATDMVPSSLMNTPGWSPNSSLWGAWGDSAKQAGLTWGGNFSNLYDPAHTQLGTGKPSAVADALDKANPIAPSNMVASTAPVAPSSPAVSAAQTLGGSGNYLGQVPSSAPRNYEIDGAKLAADIKANNIGAGFFSDQAIIDKVVQSNPDAVRYDPETGKVSVAIGDVNMDGQVSKADVDAVLADFKSQANVDPRSYSTAVAPNATDINYNVAMADLPSPQAQPVVDAPVPSFPDRPVTPTPEWAYGSPVGINPNVYAEPLSLPSQPNTALGRAFDIGFGLTPLGLPNTIAGLFGSSVGDMIANDVNVPRTPEEQQAIQERAYATNYGGSDNNNASPQPRTAEDVVAQAKVIAKARSERWMLDALAWGFSEEQLADPEVADLIKQVYDLGFIPKSA